MGPLLRLTTAALVGLGCCAPASGAGATAAPRAAVPALTVTPRASAVDSGQAAVFDLLLTTDQASVGQGLTVTGTVDTDATTTTSVTPTGPGATGWTCTGGTTTFRCTTPSAPAAPQLTVTVATVKRQFLTPLTLNATGTTAGGSGSASATVTLRGAPGGMASIDNTVTGTAAPARTTWSTMTFPITVNAAPDAWGYYFARQWDLAGGTNTAYIGIQPGPNHTQDPHFSVFGPGATIVDTAHCHTGADGGAGVSCDVLTPLVLGHRYELTVTRAGDQPDPASVIWRGTILDTDAAPGPDGTPAQPVQIGAWQLPASAGDITDNPTGFVEFYSGKLTCDQLPYADVTFGAPTVDAGVPVTVTASGTSYGHCGDQVDYTSTITGADQRVTLGFRANLSTTLSTATPTITQGTPTVPVQYATVPGTAKSTNWIGVFPAGVTPSASTYLPGAWLDASQDNGTLDLPTATLAPGSYQIWYLAANGYAPLATPVPLTVTAADINTVPVADPAVAGLTGFAALTGMTLLRRRTTA
ncbi:hypothetical protein [Kitasatospora sp. LaBMicrA B282]|uniref:hypothetical protein n=1 Tax=Kitasatospora sp. LaBMicrA B282 TaxID=3420949 RepID=UPI003D12B7BD